MADTTLPCSQAASPLSTILNTLHPSLPLDSWPSMREMGKVTPWPPCQIINVYPDCAPPSRRRGPSSWPGEIEFDCGVRLFASSACPGKIPALISQRHDVQFWILWLNQAGRRSRHESREHLPSHNSCAQVLDEPSSPSCSLRG